MARVEITPLHGLARLRHSSASRASVAFPTGALQSAAARSKHVAASQSSTAERGPSSQAA
eukprot:scaffold32293_cov67-Phaeocystis_antarctica.AAC.1